MSKPLLLDLFCGAGGAAMGYHRADFEVVGVDIEDQPNYRFGFYQEDAMHFPLASNLEPYSVIHASPPCQAYIQRNKNLDTDWPKLVEPVRELLQEWGGTYIIENVIPDILRDPVMLCGTMFGLRLRRHRYFEIAGPDLVLTRSCNHWGTVAQGQFAAVYARGGKGPRHGAGVREPGPLPGAPSWQEAMGIDWMTDDEMREAIPPAYTEFIGKQLIDSLH